MRFLITAAAAALMIAVAPQAVRADDENDIDAVQYNDANILSGISLEVKEITGELSATSASIANSFTAELGGSSDVDLEQKAIGNVTSSLDIVAKNFGGAVDLTAAAIANSATITVEGGDYADIDAVQRRSRDNNPKAEIDFKGSGVGDVAATAAAISNSLSVTTLPSTVVTEVNATQDNRAHIKAVANLDLKNTGGVDATAAAIGNSLTVSNLLND
ncbi:MAG: hypothetical protein ACFB6R_05245 [Alphaproteobacteria bacterium]